VQAISKYISYLKYRGLLNVQCNASSYSRLAIRTSQVLGATFFSFTLPKDKSKAAVGRESSLRRPSCPCVTLAQLTNSRKSLWPPALSSPLRWLTKTILSFLGSHVGIGVMSEHYNYLSDCTIGYCSVRLAIPKIYTGDLLHSLPLSRGYGYVLSPPLDKAKTHHALHWPTRGSSANRGSRKHLVSLIWAS
jgi:hypothetical protein